MGKYYRRASRSSLWSLPQNHHLASWLPRSPHHPQDLRGKDQKFHAQGKPRLGNDGKPFLGNAAPLRIWSASLRTGCLARHFFPPPRLHQWPAERRWEARLPQDSVKQCQNHQQPSQRVRCAWLWIWILHHKSQHSCYLGGTVRWFCQRSSHHDWQLHRWRRDKMGKAVRNCSIASSRHGWTRTRAQPRQNRTILAAFWWCLRRWAERQSWWANEGRQYPDHLLLDHFQLFPRNEEAATQKLSQATHRLQLQETTQV